LREVRLLPGDDERVALPCSVLHHVGFALPPWLPSARWALTPPFQPYLIPASGTIGGVFSAALSIRGLSRSPCPHFSRGTLPCGVRTFLNPTHAELRPSGKRQRHPIPHPPLWRGEFQPSQFHRERPCIASFPAETEGSASSSGALHHVCCRCVRRKTQPKIRPRINPGHSVESQCQSQILA